MSDGRATHAHDWFSIRSWAGSQNRAFEELCYQLRDPAPRGWRTIKTAAPDGGVEWYDKAPDGRCHGNQVKFVRDIDDLIPQARKSVKAVGANRRDRNVVRLVFWVPIDLPDPAHRVKDKLVEGARKRWDDNVAIWKRELPGVDGINIDLMDSGQLLERLLEPGNEGRRWFFFEQHAMGMQWLREQLNAAKVIAHDRYTPEHHVPLPISSVFDGCAVTPRFLEQLRTCCDTLVEALPDPPPPYRLTAGRPAEAGDEPLEELCTDVASALEQAAGDCEALREAAAEAGAEGLAANGMAEAAARVARLLSGAADTARRIKHWRDEAAHGRGGPGPDATSIPWWTEDRFRSAVLAAEELAALCRGDAARAAEAKAWVLLGDAGQGKTHLLVDATRRALKEGRPSVTVFGELLTAKDPLTQIAQQLGLGTLSHAALLQAMDAAGSMCEARFTLIIDALNDSAEPDRWRTALPALLAAAAPFDHLAVVVSCRSSLREAVLPDDMPGRGYLVTVHPGFAGHEVEALESYLKAAPSALPRTPMLTPAFSNPLFVKLYCDSVLSMPEARRRSAAAPSHRSAVFDSFLGRRAAQINKALALDPHERIVHRAVGELGRLMASEGREVLSREQVRKAVDALAPQCTAWPNTLLGQLIGNGLLATERYFPTDGRMETGIGFAYQAFSDDRIIHAVLEEHRVEVEAATAAGTLPADSALRTWLEGASANLIDAASILLPEMTGHELIDLLGPDTETTGVDGRMRRQRMLHRSLVLTLGLRSASSVSERTVELADGAASKFGMADAVLEAILTVATQPGHRLNADRLHRNLLGHSPVERDAKWAVDTYFMLNDSGALHRLLRWAEQLPTPACARPRLTPPARMVVRRAGLAPSAPRGPVLQPPDEQVVRLAATVLVWTLTSPNRFLRDRATKGLVQLLLGYPAVLTGLLQRFLGQDSEQIADPYLFERLVLVAHGVLARIRAAQTHPNLLRKVADLILATVYGTVSGAAHASRNALLCDAAARIVRSAHAAGLIEEADLALTQHPHPCAELGDAPDETVLDSRYPPHGPDNERLWVSLRSSLISGLADFASYEVRPAVEHFSLLPATVPLPAVSGVVPLVEAGVQAFRDSLPGTVREMLGSEESVRRLLNQDWRAREVLDAKQYRLLHACVPGPSSEQQLATTSVDKDWACRWIMDSAVRRGWTPQRFAAFDAHNGHGRGDRSGHKAERVGKKYAWLGLHELVERLANHRHMKQGPHAESTYPGAGPLSLTDIDPTLPPAAHPLSDPAEHDTLAGDDRYATFTPSALDNRWNPPAPILPSGDQITGWINGSDQLPDLNELGVRVLDDAPWIVLNEYASDHAPGQGWNGQAEQWHIQHSWLVTDAQYPEVLQFLSSRSLVGRWMPEPGSQHGIYLTDLPVPHDPAQDQAHELRIVDYAYAEQPPAAAPDQRAQSSATAVTAEPGTASRRGLDTDITNLLDYYVTGRSRPTPEERSQRLHDLATRWADASPLPASDTAARSATYAYAKDGTALQAHPAVEEYTWSGSGHDCSLDAPANLVLPCSRLLANSGLQRDPDNGDWYTPDGALVVRALHGYRTTGEVTTLLVRRDWLEQRLTALGMRLVLGMFGERQPRSSNHLRQWRDFSQTVGLEPGRPLTASPHITVVHHTDD